MTLLSAVNRMDYTGNGSADTYAYSFKIFSQSDLVITVKNSTTDVETTLTIATDYTVTGVGETSGGNIVLVDNSQDWIDAEGDLDTGWTLTIRRVRDLKQETDIRNQGDYFPEAHENAFDHMVMIDQQQQEELDRTIKLQVSYTGDPIIVPEPETDKVLGWDSDGQLQNVALDQTDTAGIADGAVTTAKLDADAVDGTKIEDDAVDSEHIASGAIDLDHMSVNSIDSDQYVDASIDFAHLSTAIKDFVYPIGRVITLGVATNPAALLGFGNWTAIEGKVIVGKAAAGTFDTLDATGGAETHQLIESEIPAHTHEVDGGSSALAVSTVMATASADESDRLTKSTGGDGSHNNLQPYIVKYVWQRTS